MSKAIDSCLCSYKPLRVIVHTGEMKGHCALELHVYCSNSSGWISHSNIFNTWCAPNPPMGTHITLDALEGKVNDLSFTYHITLQTKGKHANGLDNHFIM